MIVNCWLWEVGEDWHLRWNVVSAEDGEDRATGEYDFWLDDEVGALRPDVLLDVLSLALSREARRYRGERWGTRAIHDNRAPKKLGYIKGQLISLEPPARPVKPPPRR